MAEIVIGFRPGTEIARCDCGHEFVMRTEDLDLFEHEARHVSSDESFTTEIKRVALPYVSTQVRASLLYNAYIIGDFILDEIAKYRQ